MPAWSLTAESAEERVCVLMNHSVVEIDMFRLKCDTQHHLTQEAPSPKPNQGPNQTQLNPNPDPRSPKPRPEHFFRLTCPLFDSSTASFKASL